MSTKITPDYVVTRVKNLTQCNRIGTALDQLQLVYEYRDKILALTGEDNLLCAFTAIKKQGIVVKNLSETVDALHAGYKKVGQLMGLNPDAGVTSAAIGDAVEYRLKWLADATTEAAESLARAERAETRLETALAERLALKAQVHAAERLIGQIMLAKAVPNG